MPGYELNPGFLPGAAELDEPCTGRGVGTVWFDNESRCLPAVFHCWGAAIFDIRCRSGGEARWLRREKHCQYGGVDIIEGIDAGAADHAGHVPAVVCLNPGRSVIKPEVRKSG